jgi:hypothetical protein
MTQLFAQRALRKRRTVGDRNGPVTLLTPPLRATLGLGALIALGGALWATFARIPVTVQGTGVLLPVSTINSSLSLTNGNAFYMFNRPIQPWHIKARNFLEKPTQFSDKEMVRLASDIYGAGQFSFLSGHQASDISSAQRFSQNLKETFNGLDVPRGRLLLWVHSASELEQLSGSLDQLERTLIKSEDQIANITAKQNILQQEFQSRSAYLNSMRPLQEKGYVSRSQILEQQSSIDSTRSQIHTNNNELIRVSQQVDQAYQRVRSQLAKTINNQLIFAPRNVHVSTIIPNNGENVQSGDVLMELSDNRLDEPAMVPVFLTSNEMAQVFPGMKVLATPSGYKRSEVGGIRGEVVSMGKLPSGIDQITARIGVKAMAQVIVNREPSPTLAVVALQRSDNSGTLNSGGYVWSSNSELPFPPTPGDQLNVEITTRRVAPISLVLPAIKGFFGVTPPDRVPNTSLGKNQKRP